MRILPIVLVVVACPLLGHANEQPGMPVNPWVKQEKALIGPDVPVAVVWSPPLNDQVPGEWSFKGNPWMTGHTYKSTGYDPNLKCMVFAPHKYTYFFDPKTSKWSRNNEVNPYVPSFYTVGCHAFAGRIRTCFPRIGTAKACWATASYRMLSRCYSRHVGPEGTRESMAHQNCLGDRSIASSAFS